MESNARVIQLLEDLLKVDELRNIPRFYEEIEYFINRFNSDEFRIAVVGEFSSGKSTFINAILGKDVLKHAKKETTATITRIINVSADDLNAYKGKVFLENGQVYFIDDLNNLGEYTTTVSEGFSVVNDVDKVEIYIPFLKNNNNIVFVDTPGLNGIAEGHREKTIELIKQAHACIYMLQRKGITDSDIQFLKYLANYQKNFIFIQNFIDDFNSYEGENLEDKLTEQKAILEEKVFEEFADVEFHICGLSAWLSLVSKDESIKRLYAHSSKDILPEERIAYGKESNFDSFKDYMETKYTNNYMSSIQYGGTILALQHFLHEILSKLTADYEDKNDAQKLVLDKDFFKKVKSVKERIIGQKEVHKREIKTYINEQCETLISENDRETATAINVLNEKLNKEISSCNDINSLDFYTKTLHQKVYQEIDLIYEDRKRYVDLYISFLLQNVMTTIEKYSGISANEFVIRKLNVNNIKFDKRGIYVEDSNLTRLKHQESSIKQDLAEAKKKQREYNANLYGKTREKDSVEKNLSEIKSEKSRMRSALGHRPIGEFKIKYEEYYRDRTGLIGKVTTKLFGQKKDVRAVSYYDDSAGKAYDKKIKEIEGEYSPKISNLESRKKLLTSQISRLNLQKVENDKVLKMLEERLNVAQKLLEDNNRLVEIQKTQARKEVINNWKKKLGHDINIYLSGESDNSIYYEMTKFIKNFVGATKELIIKDSLEIYSKVIEQKIKTLEVITNKEDYMFKNKLSQISMAKEKVEMVINELEDNYEYYGIEK